MREQTTSAPPSGGVVPYIPASQTLNEITLKAIVLGVVLSAVLAGANAYLGLKVGMTVSASIPAAVISMAVLRFFREHNILENNIVQTAASAGESLAAGVIFTLPALIMLHYWAGFEFLPTLAIALCGGVLGVLFTIPLRRALIIEAALQFPEGVATGEVLKAGTEGGKGARFIALAGVAGAFLKLSQTGFKLVAGKASSAVTAGGAIFGFGSELGVALLGVGYIVGLNIAVLVFAGGLISWLFGIPIFTAVTDPVQLHPLLVDPEAVQATLAALQATLADASQMQALAADPASLQVLLTQAQGLFVDAAPVQADLAALQAVLADPAQLQALVANPAPLQDVVTQLQGLVANEEQLVPLMRELEGYAAAEEIWSVRIRYLGVGAMATGGLWALFSLIKPIRDGVRSSFEAVRKARAGEAVDILRTERDTPINIVLIGTVALAVPIFVVFLFVVNQDDLGITSGLYLSTILFGVVFSLVAGFLFASVAGYMAGLVGSSNNPISGVTIATILTISLILLVLLGSQIDFMVETAKATAAAATAILVGGVVCCAAAIAGDNMQDLKAGQLVGATPYKQQIMQVVGVAAAAVVIAPVLQLLFSAYGLGDVFPRVGMDPSEALKAPQATLMSSVAEGVLTRNLPWTMIWIGAFIAVAIIVFDEVLKKRGSSFRTPVLAVAVGIYLPLELTVPIFVGGIIALLVERSLARRKGSLGQGYEQAVAGANRRGLLFASGLITGEALVGILLAIPFAAAQNTDVLKLAPEGFGTVANVLGVAAFVFFCLWLYRVARGK